MKTKVAVIIGGKSVEHEVSIISGLQAFAAIDRNKYDPTVVYISKDNRFYTGDCLRDIAWYRGLPVCLKEATQINLIASGDGVDMVQYPPKRFGNNVVGHFDVALPVVHGTNVEDGTLMGYLEMLNVPYTSCNVTSSALGMDKYLMKAALKQAGIPVLDARQYTGRQYAENTEAVLNAIEEAFSYPVIVKPVNLGSSVGISKASDRAALREAMDLACSFSERVLVERAVENLREINCSVLGDAADAVASVCEEPIGSDEILSYRDKYMSGGKSGNKTGAKSGESGGMSSLKRRCPADIPQELTDEVRRWAVESFRALGCAGVVRVDLLNDKRTGEVWVNELNTIPGSLSFYLWEAAGVSFSELLDRMITLAFKRQRESKNLVTSYDTNILAGASLGGSKGGKA